jgi:glycosidase
MISRDFRISSRTRTRIKVNNAVFSTKSNLNSFYPQAQDIAFRYNKLNDKDVPYLSAANLNASAILHYLYQDIISKYLEGSNKDFFSKATSAIQSSNKAESAFTFYSKEFPSPLLAQLEPSIEMFIEETSRGYFLHKVMTTNPAMVKAIKPLIAPQGVVFPETEQSLKDLLGGLKNKGKNHSKIEDDLFTFLITPALLHPDSLFNQIEFILIEWQNYLSDDIKKSLLNALDYHTEETKPVYYGGGKPETYVPQYDCDTSEIEAFTEDRNWMPNVIMLAKSTLVWLDQLSKYYNRPITRLDQIPNEELDNLRDRGFTALWLIGLWERSDASKKIKNLCGNPEAEASAYSLKNDQIAQSIGGWEALDSLRNRCSERGIKLAADMVPNHVGIDADWVMNHPEYFIQQSYPPYPSYTFNGENLSTNPDIEIKLEDHYYDKTDAAVTFRRIDRRTGDTRYIFHGNDGTSMPWNDTAQLDFLNPITREAVFQQIRHVALNFPIIRFDAAMTLAKKHIQRLWYPKPGCGGDIAGRTQYSLTPQEFDERIPKEFWREVVDRMAEELPDTLLLAEAFWMMEGYFVRTLGMHRVYNSAFMNMLKNEENHKYKNSIKATLEFEPEILKRYVNFMSNPDEETAFEQFGDGDKYFGVCTLLTTMPGLPMFGHGQVEGLKEKYGMEYRRAYWDEWPSESLIEQHKKRIFPLMKKRYIFSEVEHFQIYDLIDNGNVNNSTFCYSNEGHGEKAVVFYNNQYNQSCGSIKESAPKLNKGKGETETTNIACALGLAGGSNKFVVYLDFNDGLTHIIPSNNIINDGLYVFLNGFETKIYLNIQEIEDIDGTYNALYQKLGTNGVKDLDTEIKSLRLQPIFNRVGCFSTPDFLENIDLILKGKCSDKEIRKAILQISQCYATVEFALNDITDYTKSQVGDIRKIDPNNLLKEFTRFSNIFKTSEMLQNTALVMDELNIITSGILFLLPFIDDDTTLKELNEKEDTLLIPYFYAIQLEKKGLVDGLAKHTMEGASIILASHQIVEDSNISSFAKLFDIQEVRDYVLCNNYKGATYYKKESMQELIILTAISLKLFGKEDFDIDKYISSLLEKETISEYQLENFLEN